MWYLLFLSLFFSLNAADGRPVSQDLARRYLDFYFSPETFDEVELTDAVRRAVIAEFSSTSHDCLGAKLLRKHARKKREYLERKRLSELGLIASLENSRERADNALPWEDQERMFQVIVGVHLIELYRLPEARTLRMIADRIEVCSRLVFRFRKELEDS